MIEEVSGVDILENRVSESVTIVEQMRYRLGNTNLAMTGQLVVSLNEHGFSSITAIRFGCGEGFCNSRCGWKTVI
jgi:hypothetical protein